MAAWGYWVTMRQSGEPSVEEILESIKQVIARDNRADARTARKGRDAASTGPSIQETIHTARDHDDILELNEGNMCDDGEPEEQGLTQPGARASMRDSLAALAMLSEPGAAPQIVRSGETSLEALTRDLLRPALAEWLDKNLPAMVERLVAAEIARIVGKKG